MVVEVVADSSVVAAAFLADETAHSACRRLMGYASSGELVLHLTEFNVVELLAVLVRAVRRGRIESAEFQPVHGFLTRLPAVVASNGPFFTDAAGIALQSGCSLYDALPIALARGRGLPLLTLDLAQQLCAEAFVQAPTLARVLLNLEEDAT